MKNNIKKKIPFSHYSFLCVSLQTELQGPPRPLRRRAPPAKMPRPVEAHLKPVGMLKAGGGGGTGGEGQASEGEV